MFVDAALSVLISARTRHLVICDEDGRCTGLVTRTQLTAHRSTPWYTDVTRLRVTSFHDRGPFTLSATLLHDAERTMRDRALCDSPVVDDEGYVLGVLAFSH